MTPRALASWIERVWQPTTRAERAMARVLAAVEPLYRRAVERRNARYDGDPGRAVRVGATVLSVGNLTVGGTGKTPTTLWLATRLQARGRSVAIVARGYGKTRRGVVEVSRGAGPCVAASEGGDEAVMLAHRFSGPIVTAERRVEAAAHAVRALGADTIVLDDGFQHRALHRDADLVLAPPAGASPRLLPAGPFREPWESLHRARAVLAVGDTLDAPPWWTGPVFRANTQPRCVVRVVDGRWEEAPLSTLHGVAVTVVAGIARPDRVAETLRRVGAQVASLQAYPDHHAYDAADVTAVAAALRRGPVVCTEKDLVKLAPHAALAGVQAIRLDLDVCEGERLVDLLLGTGVESARDVR